MEQLKVLLLLPFFTLLLCILILFVFAPFYIYRTIISLIGKWVDPKITRVLRGLSASLLRDYDLHQDKPLSTIVVCLKGRGHFNLIQFRQQFLKQIILKRDFETGKLQFPELQQYYKEFMGYVFLKWDPNFSIDNHIKLYEHDTNKRDVTRRDLMEIWQDLMVKPFRRKRSPWEMVVIQNFTPGGEGGEGAASNLVILFRIHHGLSDGFSIQRVLLSLDTSYDAEASNHFGNAVSGLQSVLLSLRTLVRGPYDLLNKMIRRNESYHTFHLPSGKQAKDYFVVESEQMLVGTVKEIKRELYGNKVAFTAVLLSILCGGIRRFMEKNQRPFPPLHMLGIPFATKTQSNKLGNDFLIAPLALPIHLEHPCERVRELQRQLQALHKSSISQMLGLSIDLLSCLPVRPMRSLTKKSMFSTAYSTLPGPMKSVRVLGIQLEEVNFTYGTGAASLGLCFSSITYLGKFRMTIFVDKNLVESWEKAEEMVACVTEEYRSLSHNLKCD